jgi:hypothetical protein
MAVINDGKDAAILHPVLERARAELDALREEVDGTIAGLAPGVREACGIQIGQVHQAMALYEGGLQTIGEYFRDGQVSTLARGGEHVRRANFQLNDGLFNLRNQALLAIGPTDIPDYNFIHQLYEKVKTGEIPRDGNFANAVYRTQQQGLLALRQVGQQPASPDRDLMAAAYQRHVEACNMLMAYVKEGREELLEKGMNDLREALTGIRDMIPAMQMKLRTAGPTFSPMANFVINMAMEVAAGRVGDQALKDALDQLRGNFQQLKRQFEGLARGHIESVLIQEEAQKVREALDLEAEAIDEFDRFFEVREGLMLGDACNALVDAMKRLDDAQKAFQEIADREGKILCLRCSHYNERDRRTCDKCGAMLLQAAETGVMSTMVVSEEQTSAPSGDENIPVGENVQRIFLAVNQVAENEISLEQFEAEVEWMDGVVEHYASTVGARPQVKTDTLPAGQREQYEELSALSEQADAEFREAVEYFRDGLNRYRQFLGDQVKDYLVEGTRSIWEANKKLYYVQQMTAELRERAASTQAG